MNSPASFGQALADGLSISLATKQGNSTGTTMQEDEFMPYSAEITAQGGEAGFDLSKDGFVMATSGAGLLGQCDDADDECRCRSRFRRGRWC